ncbi:MAG: hypothetical protein HUJ69_04170 [Lachnospiraceae bacterium]|nr:hypothetical protein [Lachnospiraceae bacterium]
MKFSAFLSQHLPSQKKLLLVKKKQRPVIPDPLRHAGSRSGGSFRPVDQKAPYPEAVCFHTTGEFSRRPDGAGTYKAHCCPTAITNLLLTYNRAGLAPKVGLHSPGSLFIDIAEWGRRRLLYWNMFLLNYFGGVSVPLTGLYLRAMLRRYDFHPRRVLPHLLFPRRALIRSMESGHLGIVSVLAHPTYHSHTMMLCGLTTLENEQGDRLHYIRLADGWGHEPRYLCVEDLGLFLFWDIRV